MTDNGDRVIELDESGTPRVYVATFEESSCPECGHPLERDCCCPCCIAAAQAFFDNLEIQDGSSGV